jgi:hypothetical protein
MMKKKLMPMKKLIKTGGAFPFSYKLMNINLIKIYLP